MLIVLKGGSSTFNLVVVLSVLAFVITVQIYKARQKYHEDDLNEIGWMSLLCWPIVLFIFFANWLNFMNSSVDGVGANAAIITDLALLIVSQVNSSGFCIANLLYNNSAIEGMQQGHCLPAYTQSRSEYKRKFASVDQANVASHENQLLL